MMGNEHCSNTCCQQDPKPMEDDVSGTYGTNMNHVSGIKDSKFFGIDSVIKDDGEAAITAMMAATCANDDPDGEVRKLRERLQAAGIDTSLYGKDDAKPLELLHHELTVLKSCWLEEAASSIKRVVEQVQVIVVVALNGTDFILVSACQVLHDSRTRNQQQLLLWKMKPEESWEAALEEALSNRLQIPAATHSKLFFVNKDSYAYREEIEVSKGYPGLETKYKFHEVTVRLLDPSAEGVQCMGLPEGRDFATMEGVIGTDDITARLNVWEWHRLEECAKYGLPVTVQKLRRPTPRLPKPPPSAPQEPSYQVPVGPDLPLTRLPPGMKTPNSILAALMYGSKTNWEVAERIAASIRERSYTPRNFYDDCVKAFPELQLYLGPPVDSHKHVEPTSPIDGHRNVKMTSGLTSDEEYQRTFGALFAIYWLMRLDVDGKFGFCFGVNPCDTESWRVRQPATAPQPPSKPFPQMSKAEKQASFYINGQWAAFQELFVDAGILVQDGQQVRSVLERTIAVLALTAIHDIMKVERLLPKVLEEHAPFGTYKALEAIGDHDIALAYVMEHYPQFLPSFNGLKVDARHTLLFTQSKMEFNHGWFVQAEGPPGKVLRPFKTLLRRQGNVTQQDIAFYFVHWLTDLAGAVPSPLAGAEKFVSQFPHAVLASFLQSFPMIKKLASESEVKVFEDYLAFRWSTATCALPALDGLCGAEIICLQRLLCMAQGSAEAVMQAFAAALDPQLRKELSSEMARTGIATENYRLCEQKPLTGVAEDGRHGPAFLLYYAPAFLQKSGKDDPVGALEILNTVCKAGRALWPLGEVWGDVTVSLRMDTLKEQPLSELRSQQSDDKVWLLVRHNDSEGFVERHSSSYLKDPVNHTRAYQILDI
mmetsp:Transcript_49148/g.114944  ORF Transcript_49148/g.114944 Transcript_49148/m.114944 type:complete len:879 (+) Transcript_49148:43-2679(+)